jgi:hypothetical protein
MRTVSDDPDIAIHLTQGNTRDRTKSINRVEVTTGKHTLGVRLAPNGSDKTLVRIPTRRSYEIETAFAPGTNEPRKYQKRVYDHDLAEV